MATKFYLHNAATTDTGTLPAAGVTVSIDTPGTGTTIALTNKAMDNTIGTAQASIAKTTLANTADQAVPIGRWLSDPIAAQTLASQTLTIHIGASESNTSSSMGLGFNVQLWRPSTGAVIGSIYDTGTHLSTMTPGIGTTETDETTAQNSTSVTALDGDIIIVEVWRNHTAQAMATAYTNTIFFDGTTEASATTNAAYLNFANTVTMFSGAAAGGQAGLVPRRPARRPAISVRRARAAAGSTDQAVIPAQPGRIVQRRVHAVRRARPAPVPPQVAPAAPPSYVPAVARRGFKGFQPRRRTRAEVTPLQVVVTPPAYVPSIPTRHGLRGVPRRGRRAEITPPQTAVAAPPYVPSPTRRGFKGLPTGRRRAAEAAPAQVAAPPTASRRSRLAPARRRTRAEAVPPQTPAAPASARRGVRNWQPRRRTRLEVVPPQIVVTPPYVPAALRRGFKGWPSRRRARVEVTPPQVVAAPPPYVPATFRRGIKGLQPRRRTRVEVVPPQVAATTPSPYVPGIGRRWLKGLQPRRRTKAEVTPAQQAATQAPKYVAQPPRRGLKGVGAPRHRAAEVPSPQAGPPAARTRRLGRPAPRRRRPVEVTPPQVTPTAPRYLPQPPAKHTLRGLPRRGRHVTPVHTHIPVHRGQPRRPVRSLPRRIIRAVANLVGIPTTQPPVTVLGYAETQRPVSYTEAQRPVTYIDTQQPVAYAEAQRPVTYTPVQLSVTFDQEALVHLSRTGIERYQPNPSTTPAISASLWEASFDGGTTWVAAQVVSGAPTWLVAGPAATSPGSATVLPDTAWVVPALRFANAPELIVRDATFDEGQRPPTIHLHD